MLPASLVALLAAMLMLQLLLTSDVELPPAGPIGAGGAQLQSLDVRTVAASPVIAARSMFAPRAGGKAGAPTSLLGGAVVAGTVRIGGRAYAVVQTSEGRMINLPIGGGIAGWRLAALSSEGARFVRGNERTQVNYGAQPQPQPAGDGSEAQDIEEQ